MQPKSIGIAYMLNKNGTDSYFAHCNNIPPQDLQNFKKEELECTKELIVPTSVLSIWERYQSMAVPLVAAHRVEKRMNKICISKQKMNICGRALNGEKGSNGMEGEKLVHYACVSSPSLKGESLKKRAMAGESLDTELKELATSYTKKETCGKELLSLNAGHCKS